jgi:hypothetical protein
VVVGEGFVLPILASVYAAEIIAPAELAVVSVDE